jgi:hypothetical protein
VRVVSGPKNGDVAVEDDGSFAYTPRDPQRADSFVYEVNCNGLVSRRAFASPISR